LASDEIVNALTVDVEDYFHVAALAESIDRSSWGTIPTRVRKNTDVLLETFDSASVSATFFVLGWVAEKHPEIVRAISSQGHEVACHGYSHELVYKQSRKVFRDETRKAKTILEDLTGEAVMGYRAASYSITNRSLWAIDELVAAGFEYDSSIVPVRHDYYGIVGADPFPYRVSSDDGSSMIEFPPSTISLLGKRIPIGGGGYFRIFPYWFSKWGMQRINRKDEMPFSFYIHPWEVDPNQPKVEASSKSSFRHYTNLDRCHDRLLMLLQDFRFTTMRQVLDDLSVNHAPIRKLAGN
jgi:polysaccharide deacetylase family protein (PEP-CTERM system associated)